ncbi:MAG: hypothetical protein ILA17_07835 [Ruminococcus sp.]|nr:hypothetical protein [Ruminococcus sp.]MBP1537765.1 hypothetical protein [Ruminococcus sp.]
MTFVYIMMDIGILVAIVALRIILGKKYKLKRHKRVNVERSASKFSNKDLYKQAEADKQSDSSLNIGVYAPALNDYAFNSSNKSKGYRFRSNPHYEHQLVQREADRMSRRTETFMAHQSMMNNNHFNGF